MAPAEDRPLDHTPVHTDGLPPTPQRDRAIPAAAWVEAPPELHALGRDLGHDTPLYIRRIGQWLLWRAGPASHADARYLALGAGDLSRQVTYRLYADGTGEGLGADGVTHQRFRAWKESLRDVAPSGSAAPN